MSNNITIKACIHDTKNIKQSDSYQRIYPLTLYVYLSQLIGPEASYRDIDITAEKENFCIFWY